MISPIEKLDRELWDACTRQYAAKDKETAYRWQRDEYAQIKERFLIGPIHSSLEDLVQKVLFQWHKKEVKNSAQNWD